MYYGQQARVTGKYERGYNLSDHLDFEYLGGRKYDVFFDPEGLLSTMGGIASCLLGVFSGLLLMSQSIASRKKAACLIGCGIAAVLLGWIWHLQLPVIKKIWTPSFVLVAGGYSAILLGFFYQIVDVWGVRKWCRPFVWIGMNSITIYLAANIIGGFRRPAARIVGGNVGQFLDNHIATGFDELGISIVGLLLVFYFAHFLYRRKIFLRL
jgi:predicted acyltransferase